ncbi:hypothetical protein PABG_11830 [Paracoccidioides brasiliensis Pb03]|nr:hypothetical protein PABG_11830 [Paracoccidioides brasiliensis Pb03]
MTLTGKNMKPRDLIFKKQFFKAIEEDLEQKDHSEKFETAEEVFKYLQEIYENVNKLENAKTEYQHLIMRNKDDYYTFVTKFLHLAGEALVHKKDYKADFLYKIFFDLQLMVAAVCINCSTFQETQDIYNWAAHYFKSMSGHYN